MERDTTTTIDFFSAILPPEVTHAILSYLSPLDVVSASQVSQTFAGLLDSRGIWKRIVEEQFGPLDEQIYKGNTINWKNIYYRGSELLKFKKYYLASEAKPIRDFPHLKQSFGGLINERYSKSKKYEPEAFIFYLDKAKKKSFASLYYYRPTILEANEIKLLGFSFDYALIMMGTKLQLWNLTVDCKHMDEHKWKSSPNKEEICKKKCSFVRDISLEFRASNIYWCQDNCTALFTTHEGIHVIDLNVGEESICEVMFENYGAKDRIRSRSIIRTNREEEIKEVRVMNVNGVSMTFCHVSSVNGEFFVNVTTKRVHLFADKACPLTWISKSVKVAVMNSKGDQMRVVDIAVEQPKILAKYNFNTKMDGVVSSPEGHVLFVWRSYEYYFHNGQRDFPLIRAYLWEIGYNLGQIERFCPISVYEWPKTSICVADTATGKHHLILKGVGVLNFNAKMKF